MSRICIVAAGLPTNIRLELETLGCAFLNEKDVFEFDAGAIPANVFGQLLKWELRRFSQTPTYLVIDADRVLNQPTNLWSDGRPVLFCENRFRFDYLMCFNWFFGQIPYPIAPAISEIQHFDRAVLDEMVEKIQGRYKAHWAQATLAILQQVHGTAFDAGQNFGHYLGIFRAGSFEAVNGGYELSRRTGVEQGIVRMSTLGHNGRFANQIFQYAFLRTYARRQGLRAECPPWIGCSLFGHQSAMGENELPIYREDKGETDEMIRFDPSANHRDFELWGYFQNPRYWAYDPGEFRRFFQPLPFLKNPLDEAIDRLRGPHQTLVAIHLRRGDFVGGPVFWQAPEAWYLQWLAEIWPTLVNPVLYIASDEPKSVLPHFAKYAPKSAVDLNITVNGAEFYSDFYVMSQCDVLGISNSTFSFAAAMMNAEASVFARPDPVMEKMVAFHPWKSDVQLRKPEDVLRTIAA